MSERLMVVKALAAMMGNKKDLSEEEVMYVGHAALEMGAHPMYETGPVESR